MKNKGFTLIELLAVIVILAIIALIAVPIILNIIGDAKKESDKRSIELYGGAIKNAVAKVQLDGTEVTPGLLDEEFLSKVEYDGNEVNCEIARLNTDGTIYLDECTVNGNAVDYKYGVARWYYSLASSGTIGDALPNDASLTSLEGKNFYIGLEVDDKNKILSIYMCFKKGEKEYCLKSADKYAYASNQEIMKKAFGDSSCTFVNNYSTCYDGIFSLYVDSNGGMDLGDDGPVSCHMYSVGSFSCYE